MALKYHHYDDYSDGWTYNKKKERNNSNVGQQPARYNQLIECQGRCLWYKAI